MTFGWYSPGCRPIDDSSDCIAMASRGITTPEEDGATAPAAVPETGRPFESAFILPACTRLDATKEWPLEQRSTMRVKHIDSGIRHDATHRR
jgi:hypothetical protein